MDQIRRVWRRSKNGWWCPNVNEEEWGYFGVKVTKEGEEKLFAQSDHNSELQMLEVLQYATHVTDRFGGRGMTKKFVTVL